MNRIKAVFRSHSIRSAGRSVYLKADGEKWLAHFKQPAIGLRLQLATLLRDGLLKPVYHGCEQTQTMERGKRSSNGSLWRVFVSQRAR